ncbi:MAG TPA: hypothetical protein VFH51_04290 [Myxococcota bacterium]|nr:hypothetical protein [Myxococcota bacterium]
MEFDVCIQIPDLPEPLELAFPGGFALKHHLNLADLVQPAIAPLGPVLKVLDTVTAILDALLGLKDALGAPPDFAKAIRALNRLTPLPATLASFAPPVAFPAMIVACIDMILRALTEVRTELVHLNTQLGALTQVEQTAQTLGDVRLQRVFECSRHNIGQEAANLGKGLASIGNLIGVTSKLCSLAGLNLQVPSLAGFGGVPLDQATQPLDTAIDAFKALREAVPVP